MTAAISRVSRSPREALALAGVFLIAIGLGVFTGRNPALGIALAAAFAFMLIVMANLTVGVCLFLLVTFLDVLSQNQNLSVTKGAGAVLAGSWLATIAIRPGTRRGLTSHAPWLVAALMAFLVWSAVSALWAESPSATATSTLRFALDAMLMPIVFWAIRERRHVVWVYGVFVVGVLLSVLWGISVGKAATGVSAAQVGRLTGANVEANVLATLLIVCTVFASALAVVLRRMPMARVLAVLAALAATAAFFGTFSRGGIVALTVVILASGFYAGRSRPAFVALVLGVILVGAVFLKDTTSSAVQRLASTSTSGRADVWKVGLRMVRANPIVGVGSGNYTAAEPHYLLATPGPITRADLIVGTPFPAHNVYLQILAEMGVIGLVLFVSVILLSIGAAVKSVKLFEAVGDRSMEVLGRSLVLALVGILAADFFISDQYDKQLWLLLAMGPALLAIARGSPLARGAGSPSLTSEPLAPVDPAGYG